MLEPDQNQVYDLSALSQGVFIRTGVIADGSCFFHAYLRVFRPSYKHAKTAERARIVSQLRRALASTVSERTLNANIYMMLFVTKLRQALKEDATTEHDEVLRELVDMDKIVDECSSCTDNLFTHFVEKINAAGRAAAGEEADLYDEKLVPYVDSWARALFAKINQAVVHDFKERLLNDQVGCVEMEFIARSLRCNLLFVKDHHIYPFKVIVDKNWPFLVLIWISESHFEIVGCLRANRAIQRKFMKEDELTRAFF